MTWLKECKFYEIFLAKFIRVLPILLNLGKNLRVSVIKFPPLVILLMRLINFIGFFVALALHLRISPRLNFSSSLIPNSVISFLKIKIMIFFITLCLVHKFHRLLSTLRYRLAPLGDVIVPQLVATLHEDVVVVGVLLISNYVAKMTIMQINVQNLHTFA